MYVRNIKTDKIFKAYQWNGIDRPPFKQGKVAGRETWYGKIWLIRISYNYWKEFYSNDWILEDSQGNQYIEEHSKFKNEYEEEKSLD